MKQYKGIIFNSVNVGLLKFHPTEDYNFEPFVKRTHVTDDSVATSSRSSLLNSTSKHRP